MPGDSIANLKLFPSDEESSDSSLPFEPDPAKDKDPPYNPRFVSIFEDVVYFCTLLAPYLVIYSKATIVLLLFQNDYWIFHYFVL
jgi:hypothetical protein